MGYSDNVVNAESGGDPNSQSTTSSAGGPSGFIDSTWLSTIRAARPDLADGKSDAELLPLKNDPVLAPQMADYLGNTNGDVLAKNGLPVTDGTKYLAHFAGAGGAVKVLQADPNAPVSDILGPAVMKANPFLQGMTAQGLQAWAAKKMGVTAPQPGVQQASPASPPGAPLQLAPQAPPIFAQQPQAAPQQQGSAPSAPFDPATFAAPQQAPPIFAPPRKPVDLAALMAAFKAPNFNRG